MLIESLKNYVLNYFGVIVPLVLVFFPCLEIIGISYSAPFPSVFTILWQLAVCLLLEDFFEYWGHRGLHWKPIYPYVHKVHHHFKAPFALTGSYAHPIEVLSSPFQQTSHLTFRLAWYIIDALPWRCDVSARHHPTPSSLHLHPMDSLETIRHCCHTLWIWTALQSFLFAWVFLRGYGPSLSLAKLPAGLQYSPLTHTGTRFHDYHHTSFNYNYASRFTLIDRLCGTYKEAEAPTTTSKSKQKSS